MLIIIITAISSLASAVCDFTASPVSDDEIPETYTESQLTAKAALFSRIQELILGSAQMSEDEFCSLNSEFSSYTEEQKQITDLIFRETWILIEGSNQMSQDEYDSLKLKYDKSISHEENSQNNSQETAQNSTEDIIIETEADDDASQAPVNIPDSQSDSQTTSQKNTPKERIVLNSPSEESTDDIKIPWSIYALTITAALLIIFIALRKL